MLVICGRFLSLSSGVVGVSVCIHVMKLVLFIYCDVYDFVVVAMYLS